MFMIMHYEPLGIAVKQALESNSFTPTFLSRQIAYLMGFVSSGFMEYMRSVKNGCIYGKPNIPQDQEKGLERLAILLYALGFPEDHVVIAGLRDIDGRFKYPPENGSPYVKIKEAYKAMARDGGAVGQRLEAMI